MPHGEKGFSASRDHTSHDLSGTEGPSKEYRKQLCAQLSQREQSIPLFKRLYLFPLKTPEGARVNNEG